MDTLRYIYWRLIVFSVKLCEVIHRLRWSQIGQMFNTLATQGPTGTGNTWHFMCPFREVTLSDRKRYFLRASHRKCDNHNVGFPLCRWICHTNTHWTFAWNHLFSHEWLQIEKLNTRWWQYMKKQKCIANSALWWKHFEENFIKSNNSHRTSYRCTHVSLSTDNYTLFAISTWIAFLVIVLESCRRKVQGGHYLHGFCFVSPGAACAASWAICSVTSSP